MCVLYCLIALCSDFLITSSLSPALQHLQNKHLFLNIDELQLQTQLLRLGRHHYCCVVYCDRKKKQGFGYNPLKPHKHTATPP